MTSFQATRWRRWGVRDEHSATLRSSPPGAQRLTACEIEVESTALEQFDVTSTLSKTPGCRWRVVSEGSLRNNGYELVSINPLPTDELLSSLGQVHPLLDGIVDTFRAAVHVHVNVQDLTREQYARVVVGYAVAEPSIYAEVGGGRDESVFCVPWMKANAYIRNLMHAYYTEDRHGWSESILSSPKYAGLNLAATARYGSVEFRHLPTPCGTSTRIIEIIGSYISRCTRIVRHATSDRFNGMSMLEYANILLRRYPMDTEHMLEVYSLLGGEGAAPKEADRLQVMPAEIQYNLPQAIELREPVSVNLLSAATRGRIQDRVAAVEAQIIAGDT